MNLVYTFLVGIIIVLSFMYNCFNLFQGRDDLRQDAVMQQIFVLVNQLLKREPSTKKRRLCVRTYKVSC